MRSADLLAVLEPDEASALRRLASLIGFDADEDLLPPPLVTLIETAAVFSLAAGTDAPREARVRAACEALQLDEAVIMRRWYRWQQRAACQNVSRVDDAA